MQLCTLLAVVLMLSVSVCAQSSRVFTPAAESWFATDGTHINAHGGGILFHDGLYYWYGENRAPRGKDNQWVPSPGVSCYSSSDLFAWKHEGVVMKTIADDNQSDITIGCNIERPKVVYNVKTKQFVMWFHLEFKGARYGTARAALAVSDSPVGPFRFIRSVRPNAGKWPLDFPTDQQLPLTASEAKDLMKGGTFRKALVEGAYTRRDFSGGQMSRDMTLFVDDDAKAYLVSSAEENFTLNIHELTGDYLDFTGKWMRVAPGGHNEAPAIVKHNGKYHMLASGCTGWDPNPARVLVADSIWGPWKNVGNPCIGTNPADKSGPEKTFGGQSTWILQLSGKPNAYIAMFDVWRSKNLATSGHMWLPVKFEGDRMIIQWKDRWDLGVFDSK